MKEYDLIGDVGLDITPVKVAQMLSEAAGDDVTFYMASLGGSLSDGNSIYGLIKNYKGNTTGVIIGNTASAGTIAILGCDRVVCNYNAPFLIHNSSVPEGGNAIELKRKAVELERMDKLMRSVYVEKTGLPEEKIAELMALEDWLTPEEALSFGFVDEVQQVGLKAVAYASQTVLTADLQTKLINKMNLFKTKKDAKPHLLALKDGKNILMSAETVAQGVEVSPLGAMTLEDGTYELSDGRKITIAGGVVTEVVEVAPPAAPDDMAANLTAFSAEVVAQVTKILAEETEKIRADFKKEIDAVKASVTSKHVPPKGKDVQARVADPDKETVHDRVQAAADKIREGIVQSRKA